MAEIKEESESNKRVIYTYPMVKQVTTLALILMFDSCRELLIGVLKESTASILTKVKHSNET